MSDKPKYLDAEEDVAELFKDLVSEHDLTYLLDYNIKFLFNTKPRKRNGRRRLGSAEKCSPKNKAMHGYDFLIMLDYEFWHHNEDKQAPLLYHELLHCSVKENGEPAMRAHDIEEFGEVVNAYGMWKQDIKHFRKQMDMFDLHDGGVTV